MHELNGPAVACGLDVPDHSHVSLEVLPGNGISGRDLHTGASTEQSDGFHTSSILGGSVVRYAAATNRIQPLDGRRCLG